MKKKSRGKQGEEDDPKIPVAERMLIEEIPDLPAETILCTTLGRGQFAQLAAEYAPRRSVVCHCFDFYDATAANDFFGAGEGKPQVDCTPDFRHEQFDLAVFPIDPRGEMELARDILQSGFDRLKIGGTLLAATSNPEDQWLHGELKKMFDKVTRQPQKKIGVLYRGVKTGELKKHKNFDCEFAFRDLGRLFRIVSRPSVFSHRSLDAGARALINSMEIGTGAKVLDIGCGSGAVSLAAAVRAEGVQVVALDSNPRAIECTAKSAELNGLKNITAILNADGEAPDPGTYDLVLGNPPYYSHYQIAEIFLQAAQRALRPGGKVQIVCKSHEFYDQRMPQLFDQVTTRPERKYFVVEGIAP